MSDRTKIEWTRGDDGTPGATWNPVTGCTKLSPASPGCERCYAATFAERFRGTPGHYFERGFDVQLRPDKLDQPLRWRKPRKIFVNSMSDLFHDAVPDEYIAKVFAIMLLAQRHTFQVLTKRHGRMRTLLNSHAFWTRVLYEAVDPELPPGDRDGLQLSLHYLPNVWLGVSTENQQWADIRIPSLLETPAAVRFISAEPLLGPIDLDIPRCQNGCDEPYFDESTHTWRCVDCVNDGGSGELAYGWWLDPCPENDNGVNWVIVGGESGPGARPMHPDWVRSIRDQCTDAGVPFLFKQHGEYRPVVPSDGDVVPDLYVQRETGHYVDDDGMWNVSGGHWCAMRRLGKKRAGRELDGTTWEQYPLVEQVSAHA